MFDGLFDWWLSPVATNAENMLDVAANLIVGVMCLTLTVQLFIVWWRTDGRRYPRWSLIAISTFYAGFSIRRLLVFVVVLVPAPRLIIYFEYALVFITGFGMVGNLALASWVQDRTRKLYEDYTHANSLLAERTIERDELKTRIAMFETKQMLSEVNLPKELPPNVATS